MLSRQRVFIRTANAIPGFSGDILVSSACAPYQPSQCDPLRVPNFLKKRKILLLDSEGNPIRSARLNFHEFTKRKAKLIASLMTDADGVADVSSLLETGGLMRMFIDSVSASGEFLVQFTKGGMQGQQTNKLFHRRCTGNVMQGAIVQP